MSTTDPDIAIIETSSLGDRSYLISHDGIAVVIDPQRDIDRVRALAAEKNAVITTCWKLTSTTTTSLAAWNLRAPRVPNTSSRTAIRSNTSAEQSSTAMSSTRDRRRSRSCTPQAYSSPRQLRSAPARRADRNLHRRLHALRVHRAY